MIPLGSRVTIAFVVGGNRLDPETFTLTHPTTEGPDDALNPESIVGALVLHAGVGDRVEYFGNPDRLGRRQRFVFDVLAVELSSGEVEPAA